MDIDVSEPISPKSIDAPNRIPKEDFVNFELSDNEDEHYHVHNVGVSKRLVALILQGRC